MESERERERDGERERFSSLTYAEHKHKLQQYIIIVHNMLNESESIT
jgi:hypothetical protein